MQLSSNYTNYLTNYTTKSFLCIDTEKQKNYLLLFLCAYVRMVSHFWEIKKMSIVLAS